MDKKIRAIGALLLVAVWAVLTGFAWFSPAKEISEAERRPLEQMPQINADTLLNGRDAGGDVLQREALVDVCAGRNALQASTTAAKTTISGGNGHYKT